MIDGASRFTAFRQIILPLTPGVAATVGFVFTAAWSEMIFALMLISSKGQGDLPGRLLSFVSKFSVDFGQDDAAACSRPSPPASSSSSSSGTWSRA